MSMYVYIKQGNDVKPFLNISRTTLSIVEMSGFFMGKIHQTLIKYIVKSVQYIITVFSIIEKLEKKFPLLSHYDLFVSEMIGNKKTILAGMVLKQCSIVRVYLELNEIVFAFRNCRSWMQKFGLKIGKYLIFPYALPYKYHIPFFKSCKEDVKLALIPIC